MSRRLALLLSLLIALAGSAIAADISSVAGHWEGGITIQAGTELGVVVELSRNDDGTWTGHIDIPLQAARNLPLINIAVKDAAAEFEISGPAGKPVFHGMLSGDGNTLSGTFTQGGQTFPFTLRRGAAKKTEAPPKSEAEILQSIRERVKSTMTDWHVPGLALALIKDGKVILSEGFGERSIKTHDPVTPDTLFAIGSSTKAFTATVMGIAVDEGKVKWDEPVRTYLPDFRLQDEFASQRMTPRDLLCHRSGLPRHDIMWYGSTLSRKEMYERLRYLQPSEDFRTTFQYQNLMFLTAGYLEEQIEGRKWEDLVKEKIWEPLGMSHSNFTVTVSQAARDYALPYEYKDVEGQKNKKEVKEMPFRNIDAVGPAGSINSNLVDMSRWILMNMNKGTLDGKTIVSPGALDEIQSPQMIVRGGILSQLLSFPETPYLLYGMGWFIQPYRGHRLLHHGGNIDGFSAMVSFMPDDKLGLVILTNMNENIQVDSLMFEIYDRLLGMEPIDWNGRYKLLWAQLEQADKLRSTKEDEVIRKPNTKPSHPLQDFTGDYEHPAYGTLSVESSAAGLKATLHGITSPLEHFHYDIFKAVTEPMKGMKLTFLTNLRGDIDHVSVPLETGVDEIVFTRVAPASMKDPAFLKQFAGEYELVGMTLTVALQEDHLSLTVPGQPSYILEPYLGSEFNLKGQKGFSIRFTIVKDKVTEAVLIQPNGVFTAKRK